MTTLPGGFDPRQHAPATGEGGQLPVSDKNGHLVVIKSSEVKQTSNQDGWLLALELEIVDGPNAGATGVDRLNLGNKSAETVAIALRQLSAICHCVGWLQPVTDTACLHDKQFRVIVELQKDKDAAAKGYTQVRAYRTRGRNQHNHRLIELTKPVSLVAAQVFQVLAEGAFVPQFDN